MARSVGSSGFRPLGGALLIFGANRENGNLYPTLQREARRCRFFDLRSADTKLSRKRSRHSPPPIVLGPLPVDVINRCMGTELEPGDLIVPTGMEVHIGRKRPGEYARLLPHLGAVTASPLYVGDDFKNDGIEIVGSAPGSGGEFILIAVCVEVDATGRYQVRTFYSLSREKIEQRRQKGVLKLA